MLSVKLMGFVKNSIEMIILKYNFSLILLLFFFLPKNIFSQDNFLEIDESIYTSALSDNMKTLAIASKKNVYLVDVNSMTVSNTIEVIKERKSENTIYKLEFHKDENTLHIKTFTLDKLEERYDYEDYLKDKTFVYDLNMKAISQSYSGLEYINGSVSAFNKLKKEISYYEPEGSYIELNEGHKLFINDTLLTDGRYKEWESFLQFMKESEEGILRLKDDKNIKVKGKIRHVTVSKDKSKIGIVYYDSLVENLNSYKIEIRNASTLDFITEKKLKTNRIIEKIKFVENDQYLAVFQLKITPNYRKKQSKTSVYWENFRPDYNIEFLDSKTLMEPINLVDIDKEEFLIEGNSFWVIEDDNIVNYEFGTNKVLSYINTLDFEFHRTRGFYKISDSECLIIGSAEDEYDKDYITKNGVIKYSLKDTKLYNQVSDYKEVDTLFTTGVPFIQNNNFIGNKIQFSADKKVFMSSMNTEKVFQLWSIESRKKLHDIDLKTNSSAYLNENGDIVLIFSRLDNLDNGFLLRSLNVNSGLIRSKQYVIRDGKSPLFADFYYNYNGSKWIGIARDHIWEIDTDKLTFKLLTQEDFKSGYVYDYHFLGHKGNEIFFKGTSGSDINEINIEGVWSFNIESNKLQKVDVFTNKKNVFQYSANKFIAYKDDTYSIYDVDTFDIIAENNLNSQFIYNVIFGNNKSYILLGDGQQYSDGVNVLEYENASNTLLNRFRLDIRYYDYSDFNNFFVINDGLVYDDQGQLKLFNSDLAFTTNWQELSNKKYIRNFDIGKDGSLIIDGVSDLNLKSLEINNIEPDRGIHDVAEFFISPYSKNSQLMFLRSYGHSENNWKSYVQCKVVKNNLNKDVIWESNKINDKDIVSFTNVIVSEDKQYAILYKDSYLDHYYFIDIENRSLHKMKLPFKNRFLSDRNFVIGKSKLYIFDSGDINKENQATKTYVYTLTSRKLLTTIKDIQVTDEFGDEELLYVNWENGYGTFFKGHIQNEKIQEDFKFNSFGTGSYIYDTSRHNIIGSLYNEILFWKPSEKTPFRSLKVSNNGINGLKLFEDKLYVLLWDSQIRIIDLIKFEELLNIEILEKNNILKPVYFTPEGYFKAAKENIRKYHFVKGNDAFPLLNYELFLNRPDVILQRLGFANNETIDIYREAFLKRLKRNGLSEETDFFNLKRPSVILSNKANIKSISNIDSISLSLQKSPDVNELFVYINGVPVFKDVADKKEINITLQLSNGLNRITVIGKDSKGTESDPITLEVTNTVKAIPSKIFYVGIGVSDYLDKNMNLRFADKDVRSISKLLNEKFSSRIEIDTLNNAKATKDNILSIKEKLKKSNINDIVIISFSGHGMVDDKSDFYFATHDIDFANPSDKGLSYEDIQSLLDDIPARKKLLLLDACHSGEIDDEDEIADTNTNGNVNGYLPQGAKGSKASSVKSGVGLRNSFELMQSLFYDLDRGNGSFVISAAGGKEFAFESEDWGNGVFTYSFINAINKFGSGGYPEDGKINISELKNYIYNSVSKLTNNQQKPTSRAENLEWDWVLD